MAITGINNSSYTSYYASNYKNTVKKTDSEKDSTRIGYMTWFQLCQLKDGTMCRI